jgi:two-component system response regulator YesN
VKKREAVNVPVASRRAIDCMLRMLLVEDNVQFRKTVKSILSIYFPSVEIEEASNGREAMEIIVRFQPDVAMVDISLPEENGLILTRRIKASNPRIKIIILTTFDFLEYREAAIKAGADYFMAKGNSSVEQIAHLIQSILSEKQLPLSVGERAIDRAEILH